MSIDDEFELSRKLKSISASDLEKIIAAAVGKSLGEDYKVHIRAINYNSEPSSDLTDASEITLTIKQEMDTSGLGDSQETE